MRGRYTYARSAAALELAVNLAGYIGRRVERLIERTSLAHHWMTLDAEFGGVNDVLWKLAKLTGRSGIASAVGHEASRHRWGATACRHHGAHPARVPSRRASA